MTLSNNNDKYQHYSQWSYATTPRICYILCKGARKTIKHELAIYMSQTSLEKCQTFFIHSQKWSNFELLLII